MSLEEICGLIAQRLLQGSMTHQQFTKYYSFLALQGYKKCHEFHFLSESCSYEKFVSYFIQHYNRLVPKYSFDTIFTLTIIPENWYSYSREDVDINTKRNAVKNGLEKYVQWEKDTKRFFEDMYIELIGINEVALALQIKEYIDQVDQELQKAERQYLEIKSTDYDMPTVVSKQAQIKKKYQKKMKRKEYYHAQSSRSGIGYQRFGEQSYDL